ncbi:MAG: hypothetical protein EP297_06755, partial [Gammaproteobacteria bacterium]
MEHRMKDSPSNKSDYSNMQLLSCLARKYIDPDTKDRISSLLKNDPDWTQLFQNARFHGVIPLVYKNLGTFYTDAVPDEALDKLSDSFLTNEQRNIFLTELLLKLLDLFDRNNVPAISYTGPVLASTVYGDVAFRQFFDLDILIREQDVEKAENLLLSQGYVDRWNRTGPFDRESKGARAFLSNDRKVHIDLHWASTLMRKDFYYPNDDEHLWSKLNCVSVSGKSIDSVPPEVLLQILCIHGTRSYWEKLKWICDVAELLRTYKELDWVHVIDQASKLGNRRILFLGLWLARDLLGAVLPLQVLQSIEADKVVALRGKQIRERLLSETRGQLKGSEHHYFYLAIK